MASGATGRILPLRLRPPSAFSWHPPRTELSHRPGFNVAAVSLGAQLEAGAGFVPDSYGERRPLVAAHWVYAKAEQAAKKMQRIGIAA